MKRTLFYISIFLLVLFFFFSLFEIVNIMALYGDQTRFIDDECRDIVDIASELTSTMNFFIYSSIIIPIVIVLLFYIRNLKKKRQN